jgi:hypothetical protein
MTEQITLAELVTKRVDEGWTFREMSRRAKERGYDVSHSHLAEHAKGLVAKVPDRTQVEALAAALDVGIDDVRAAAMQQYWGYVPRELRTRKPSRVTAALPADLTAEEEDEIARMVEAWLAARRRNL